MDYKDDYDIFEEEFHRSRVAKKQAEQESAIQEEMMQAKARQQEYSRLAKERQQNKIYSSNSKIVKRPFQKSSKAAAAEEARRYSQPERESLFDETKFNTGSKLSDMSENTAASSAPAVAEAAVSASQSRSRTAGKRTSKHAKASSESTRTSAREKVDKVALNSGVLEKVDDGGSGSGGSNGSGGGKKKKKYKLNIKQFIKFCLCVCIVIAIGVIGFCWHIISEAPEIDTSDVNSLLSQSTVLYDDAGKIIDNVFGDKNRTLVEIGDIPLDTQNAFIALEDKTFKTHHGFNIIRIMGAIKDALVNDRQISGTSTITQQLARNLYMEDQMTERSINRKLIEAYYAVQLEKNLSKDQILEAYLNCVNFGDIYGIQTASQTYFSKDVKDLTIAESSWLVAIPQYPSAYKLVKKVSASTVTEETENVILKRGEYAYLWNDAGKDRRNLCLRLMVDQGYLSEEEYEEAKAVELADIIDPTIDALEEVSNYFADYVIKQVIADLQEEYGYDYAKAQNIVYNKGIEIYTTLDSKAQKVLEKEFKNNDNFPVPINYKRDSNNNILQENGSVLLYAFSNYIEKGNCFKLKGSEYDWNPDGSLTIYSGKRLAIYNTTVQGTTDYSVEFRPMYEIVDGIFYSIPGGYLNIPQAYKSRDNEDNLVVSAQFFEDYPSFFEQDGDKLVTTDFSLKQRTIQPQAAMTIVDNETGAIKAMIGGRKITGRMLFNRATATRQPGSSIKPLAVYSAALQKSYELQQDGKAFSYTETGYDKQGTEMWGDYITAGSIVEDEPLTVNGKIWPKNSYRGYRGIYTFRQALQQSVNVCAVKILAQVGVDYAYEMAEKYGLTTLIHDGDVNDLNLAALGMGGLSQGVSTLEMASAYTTFVNDGIHKSYSCYTKVLSNNGDILLEPDITEDEVLDPGVAWIMRDVLQSVVSQGIAGAARISGEKVGGKTGTTSDSYDIWFDGFTANYSAALWIGNDVNIKLSSMSNKAAALWSKVMKQIPDALGGKYTSKPKNVVSATIDTKTGMLAAEDSKHKRTEYYTKGTQPKEVGSLTTVEICTESGYLATPACPETETKTGTMRTYTPSDKVGDYDSELPHYYCNLHNPDPEEYPVEEGLDVTIVEPNEGEIIDDEPTDTGDEPINDDPDDVPPIPDTPPMITPDNVETVDDGFPTLG